MYWSFNFPGGSMNKMGQKIVAMIALGTFALVIGLGELRPAQAQEAKESKWSVCSRRGI
jgi:hypothetical protein